MRLLVITHGLPMPDRASGDLRFFTLLRILSERHKITFCDYEDGRQQREEVGEAALNRYRDALEGIGVRVSSSGVIRTLEESQFDVVLFEFYYSAYRFLSDVRYWQPTARVVVDSVDVHFARFAARARLSGVLKDQQYALEVKEKELHAYANSDVVIAVTEDDKNAILRETPTLSIEVIPNIHPVFDLPPGGDRDSSTLVFVGGFNHEPNVDAMLFFCREVLPIIRTQEPATQLLVIGNAPPPEIRALADENIVVLGFVPDTGPYLRTAYISIAPLRYGGGMKGKVGEAMAHGLPVVTTSVGVEGFGLTPEHNVLVGDTAQDFAAQVIALRRDPLLYESVSTSGWRFIRDNYSEAAVKQRIHDIFTSVTGHSVKRLSRWQALNKFLGLQLERRLLWRLRDK